MAARIESDLAQLGGHRALSFIEHLDVAAQREGCQHEFSLLARVLFFRLPGEQRFAKAYRETQYLHTAGDCHAVMAVFVDGNQQRQRDNKSENGQHGLVLQRGAKLCSCSAACSIDGKQILYRMRFGRSDTG
jgi:hypothetical protein